MTSMLNRVPDMSAVVFGVLIAFVGMASAQQADDAVSGDGVRAGGFAQPNVGDRHILEPFDDSDQPIRVYGAAQNAGTDDRDQHVYLYEPPLRFRVADDGTIVVRRNGADPRKVIFYLEGMNQDLEKRIQELLDADGIKVLARNVRPLQYTFMMLSDDSGQWRSRHPEDNESLPAPQNWIPFEVDFTGHEDGAERADEFVKRLWDQEVEFRGILGYGGREISVRAEEYYVTARRGTARFRFTISSRQGRSGAVSDFPSGAVVAFDREDGCPPGWSEYGDADGRFIVGDGRHAVHDTYGNEVAELEFGEEGGERTHRLSVSEMPSHDHVQWYASGERFGGPGPETAQLTDEDLRGVQFPTRPR